MTPNPSSEIRLDLDHVFTALSQRPRRRILISLMTENSRWQDEFETVEFKPDDSNPEAYSVALHHQHLPHLDAADFIDWEQRTGLVTRGENFEAIRPLLELMDAHRDELPDDWP